MRLFSHSNYKFIERRKTAYVLSGTAITIALGAMLLNIFEMGSWQNYGVDFTGGSLVQVNFNKTVTPAEVRAALGGRTAPPINRIGKESDFVIRAPLQDRTIENVAADIEAKLSSAIGPGTFTVARQELVGAKVGSELQEKAALAIIFSFLLTLIYLAFRFETRFGAAAVIATVHDTIITLGFLAAFRLEIALPTVAAILTIVGYSLNDTIVVFDRIRENLNKKGGRKRNQVDLINESINETLPRTILTSGTTIATLLALLLLGGSVIRNFTVVLVLGIVVGTYSSIFVASPALLEIQKRWGEGSGGDRKRKKKSRAHAAAV
jgi:preprotein translocase subunit SecF